MADPSLVLRDIHQPPAPPWWPLAPGWWVLAALLLLAFGAWLWWTARRRRQRRAVAAVFDDAVAAAATPAAQVAAISELLRRAARRRQPGADRLHGQAWLAFIDLDEDAGRLLLDGGYRPDIGPQQVDALRPLARARFLQWMDPRRKAAR
ncbi:MAG: DUF4381 family protein [Lysobacter sp.]